ncbi:MAG: ATP-binding protein [Candidatus Kapabacteria bacterium]|jgi:signal transduction histidine kinase|nr:ATP-binding protein [Candidatus Kapabacteria bacterium]
MLDQVIAYFMPEALAHDTVSAENQRARLIILAAGIIIVLASSSVVGYAVYGAYLLSVLAFAAVLLSIAALLLLRYKASLQASVIVMIVGLLVILFGTILFTGGVLSPLIFSLYAPPIFGLLFFDRKVMVQIFAVCVVFILVVIGLHWQRITFPLLYPAELHGYWQGVISIPLLIGVIGAFFFSDTVRRQTLAVLLHERDSIQEKVQEATAVLQEQQENISRINTSLAEQNVQLQNAIQEAETAKKLQTDFLRNVSHEVRTPLSAVLGFAEILQDRAHPDDMTSKEFIEQIHLAGQNLLDMFNNILALSTIEASGVEVTYELGHLPTLLHDIERSLAQNIAQKGLAQSITWTKECEKPLLIDAHNIREILRYLLANAVKFTEHGTITLHCELALMPDTSDIQSLRLSVRDTGVGMEQQYLENLFQTFRQQDASKNRRYGGLGLGLSIVKRLVDAMHGVIRCESVVGEGTTFIVDIPQGKIKKLPTN